ncbi:DMT family transporter [Spirulina subsalsa FACHB-351]|uniref:DMT family transporter n=1 Tax=Spirulina subsalsa FACHB-351 TaxID=234711 RepID=A0ABT3L531_9CYAN|nr:DMT family transporter [Spirulina subsalsa]MCW6036611.1 DMT family transporter [Spirulina subsalsa FACHB-351]
MAQTLTLSSPSLQWPRVSPMVSALVAVFLAIATLSFASILIRLSERELGPFSTIFNRFWIAFVILAIIYAVQGVKPRQPQMITGRDRLLLISAAVLFWACLGFWAWSLTLTGVANSTVLHNLTPLFTTLGAWLIWRESFDRRFLVGLGVAMIGAIALGIGDFEIGAGHFNGDLAAFLSAILSAANLMLIEKLRAKFPALIILLWCCGVGAILSWPVVLMTEQRLFPITLSGWLSVAALALVCQVIGQGLQAYSLKHLPSSLVGIFLLLDPVFAGLIAWMLFAEGLNLINAIAFGTVLLGMYLAQSSQYSDRIFQKPCLAKPNN